jgi:hypothetical protein
MLGLSGENNIENYIAIFTVEYDDLKIWNLDNIPNLP